jgi:zinc protease
MVFSMSVSLAGAQPPVPTTVAPLTLPPITEEQLPNGLSVITVEQHTLPLAAVRLVLLTGAVRDPKGKEGLATLTGQLLRRGTAKRTATEIDDAIESTSIAATVPSEHTATAVDVIADLARHASFPKKEFELAKRRELAQLLQDLDDPAGLTDRALVRFFYGPDHPYGHPAQGQTASVTTLKREDVIAFQKNTFTPTGAMLIFAGDIDPKTAGQLARQYFGDWTGPKLAPITIQPAKPVTGLDILIVDKPDATQAQVRATVPGIPRKDSAYYATQLANVIVGGAFTSRLVDEVRVNRGLTYGVGTRVVASRDIGAVTFSSSTKTETVRGLLDVSFKVLDDFRDKGPTEDELARAKRLEIGLFPGKVESVDQLANALAQMRLLGMPFDTISEYRGRMAAVTSAEALGGAKRFPSSGGAKVVVLGKASAIRPQLEGLGKITVAKAKDFE